MTKAIYFGAQWCGPCKIVKPMIEALNAENDSIDVSFVDVDKDGQKAAQYGVRALPTLLVLNKDDRVEHTLIGLQNIGNIKKALGLL